MAAAGQLIPWIHDSWREFDGKDMFPRLYDELSEISQATVKRRIASYRDVQMDMEGLTPAGLRYLGMALIETMDLYSRNFRKYFFAALSERSGMRIDHRLLIHVFNAMVREVTLDASLTSKAMHIRRDRDLIVAIAPQKANMDCLVVFRSLLEWIRELDDSFKGVSAYLSERWLRLYLVASKNPIVIGQGSNTDLWYPGLAVHSEFLLPPAASSRLGLFHPATGGWLLEPQDFTQKEHRFYAKSGFTRYAKSKLTKKLPQVVNVVVKLSGDSVDSQHSKNRFDLIETARRSAKRFSFTASVLWSSLEAARDARRAAGKLDHDRPTFGENYLILQDALRLSNTLDARRRDLVQRALFDSLLIGGSCGKGCEKSSRGEARGAGEKRGCDEARSADEADDASDN